MKAIIRYFLFTVISLLCVQYVINGFVFSDENRYAFWLLVLALFLLNVAMKPVLAIIALPTSGIGFFFINLVLIAMSFYVLTLFISGYSIQAATLPELSFFGIVLPGKVLTPVYTEVYSALIFCLVFNFFNWLTESKKR